MDLGLFCLLNAASMVGDAWFMPIPRTGILDYKDILEILSVRRKRRNRLNEEINKQELNISIIGTSYILDSEV